MHVDDDDLIDIPLVPSLITGDPDREPNFILHWLNNKEMQFTMQAENILQVQYILFSYCTPVCVSIQRFNQDFHLIL